jgi:hypothetical protein
VKTTSHKLDNRLCPRHGVSVRSPLTAPNRLDGRAHEVEEIRGRAAAPPPGLWRLDNAALASFETPSG